MLDQLAIDEARKWAKIWQVTSLIARSAAVSAVQEAHEFFRWDARPVKRPDVLIDFGCGDCEALNKLWNMGYAPCYGVDIVAVTPQVTQACLWNLPPDLPHVDYGFCVDVMEHIPRHMVHDVLMNIAHKADTIYFRIGLKFEKADRLKRNFTVQPAAWWDGEVRMVFGPSRVGIIRKTNDHIVIGVRR